MAASTCQTAAATSGGFITLPRELRDIIYTYLGAIIVPQDLKFGGAIIKSHRHVHSCSTYSCVLQANELTIDDTTGLFALMLTNKLFHNELHELIYEKAVLVIEAEIPLYVHQSNKATSIAH